VPVRSFLPNPFPLLRTDDSPVLPDTEVSERARAQALTHVHSQSGSCTEMRDPRLLWACGQSLSSSNTRPIFPGFHRFGWPTAVSRIGSLVGWGLPVAWGLRHHSSGAATFPWGPRLDKPFGKIVIFHAKVCRLTLVSTGKKCPDSQLFQHFSCISLAKPSTLLRGRNERRRPPAPRRR